MIPAHEQPERSSIGLAKIWGDGEVGHLLGAGQHGRFPNRTSVLKLTPIHTMVLSNPRVAIFAR